MNKTEVIAYLDELSDRVSAKDFHQLKDVIKSIKALRRLSGPAANPVEPKPKTFISYADGMICEMEELPQPVAKSQGVDDATITIGRSRCFNYSHDNEGEWFRELTVHGMTFLAPLGRQDEARHILAALAHKGNGE